MSGYGQTPIDPRAELLLGRAVRPEPIMGGMNLLGRLAALGAGQARQRSFEDEIAASRLQYATALQSAGADPNARLAALGAGLASRDPMIRMSAAEQMAKLTETDTRIISTPGGGSAAVTLQGGQLAGGPQPIVQGRAAAPNIFEVKDGENVKTFAFDSNSGTMIDLATAPRETLQRILPPEVFEQQVRLRQASGAAQGEATGAAIARIGQEAAARAQATTDVKQAAAQEAKARYQAQAQGILGQIETLMAQAGPAGALDPSLADQIDGLRTGAAVAIARAQSENPEQEPNSDIVQGFKAMIPGNVKGAAGFTGGLDAAYSLAGGRPAQPAASATQTPTAPGANLTPAELRRMAELIEKAQRGAK
jgi:hypothetical protein